MKDFIRGGNLLIFHSMDQQMKKITAGVHFLRTVQRVLHSDLRRSNVSFRTGQGGTLQACACQHEFALGQYERNFIILFNFCAAQSGTF